MKASLDSGVVAHICNPSIEEAEAGELLRVQVQTELQTEFGTA